MLFGKIFHTVSFALFPAMVLYSNNLDRIDFSEIIFPLVASLSVALTLLWIASNFIKSVEASAIIVTIWLAVFYNFFAIQLIIEAFTHTEFVENQFVFISLIFLVIISIAVIRWIKFLAPVNLFLNVLSSCLLAFILIRVCVFKLSNSDLAEVKLSACPFGSQISRACHLPDVYYIVTDSYSGNSILKEKFGYDNSGFTDFLEDQDFFVAYNSRSNYCATDLSLASSLNLSYLELKGVDRTKYNAGGHLMRLIHNSRVRSILEELGYRTVAFSSGYLVTDLKTVDEYYNGSYVNKELLDILLRTSMLTHIRSPYIDLAAYQADVHRAKIRGAINDLPDIKKQDAPIFALIHIVCPHAPFVFGKNGEELDLRMFSYIDASDWGADKGLYKTLYADQLHYLNGKLKDCIGRLIKDKSREEIIILQADHGSGLGHHYEDIKQCDLNERFSILNAIYLPDQYYEGFYNGMSPVNNFRLVLGKILGQKPELLADRSFYSSCKNRFDFVEVTGFLNSVNGEN